MFTFELDDALRFALIIHKDQFYSEGTESQEKYILHVLRVLIGLDIYRKYYPKLNWNILRIVAALHDSMEDCDVTRQDLLGIGVQERAIHLIEMLTRNKETETYEEYIERVGTDIEAVIVKLSDLQTNINHSYNLGEKGKMLRDRWTKAKEFLLNVLKENHFNLTQP